MESKGISKIQQKMLPFYLSKIWNYFPILVVNIAEMRIWQINIKLFFEFKVLTRSIFLLQRQLQWCRALQLLQNRDIYRSKFQHNDKDLILFSKLHFKLLLDGWCDVVWRISKIQSGMELPTLACIIPNSPTDAWYLTVFWTKKKS